MPSLFFLPLYENVYKPYSKHLNDVARYKKTDFEVVTLPVFSKGARRKIEKYEKVGDYTDYGNPQWYREIYSANKFHYNRVRLIIDGKTIDVKDMVTKMDILPGSHHIKIEMRSFISNPLEDKKKSTKGAQATLDVIELDLVADEIGNYFLVSKQKVQEGASIYQSHSDSRIHNTFFEYHSIEAKLTTLKEFKSNFEDDVEFINIQLPTNENQFSASSSIVIEPQTPNNNVIPSPVLNPKEVVVSQHKKVCYPAPKKYTNDEYFDVLLDSLEKHTTKETPSTSHKPKEEKITPLKFITDSDTKYAELYEDGTLRWERDPIVYVPRQVTTLHKYFLYKNTYCKKVVLPDGIDTLNNSEFVDCSSLEEIALPKNLKCFNKKCLLGCNNLKHIYLDESNPYFKAVDDVLYEVKPNGNWELLIYPVRKEDTSFRPHEKCTIISHSAFSGNNYLKSADLTNVELVDMSAFSCCRNLNEVTFGKALKEVGTWGFDTTALSQVEIPFSTKLKSNAFPKDCKVKRKFRL